MSRKRYISTKVWGTFRTFYMRINMASNEDLDQILAIYFIRKLKYHISIFFICWSLKSVGAKLEVNWCHISIQRVWYTEPLQWKCDLLKIESQLGIICSGSTFLCMARMWHLLRLSFIPQVVARVVSACRSCCSLTWAGHLESRLAWRPSSHPQRDAQWMSHDQAYCWCRVGITGDPYVLCLVVPLSPRGLPEIALHRW